MPSVNKMYIILQILFYQLDITMLNKSINQMLQTVKVCVQSLAYKYTYWPQHTDLMYLYCLCGHVASSNCSAPPAV